MPPITICANCRFFRNVNYKESNIVLGECVRFPPQYMQHRVPLNHEGGTSADYFSGPIVRGSDWCGEHKQ
jgi:hypothetical protein